MAQATFQHLRILGVDTCTGPVTRHIDEDAALYASDPAQLDRLKKLVGVGTRHLAPPGVTTLDLCEAAARRLLRGCAVEAGSLDAVVFVTQTPDYWQPCNACLLHDRLDLPKSTAAFDVNQGCSGWVYGLYLAAAMVEAGGCERVLLVAGDTVTQSIHPRDRAVVPLFGDAGSATLIVREPEPRPAWFALHSDGKGWRSIHIPAGGYRTPKDATTGVESADAEGGVRSAENLWMNGIEVFNFTLREEPGAIRELLAYSGRTIEQVDHFVFHQANRFILDNLARRIKAPPAKVPTGTAGRYGNQSSASIPATLCDALADPLREATRSVLCSGFGVGLSWASCLLPLGPLAHCEIHQFAPPAATPPPSA